MNVILIKGSLASLPQMTLKVTCNPERSASEVKDLNLLSTNYIETCH